jgi:SOS-response transcriptional repressor LexA
LRSHQYNGGYDIPVGLTIPEGRMILVDSARNLSAGDLVIFKKSGVTKILYIKYVEEASERYLSSLNQSYRMIRIDEQYAPIGVAAEAKWIF